jgi:uncharacterized membrane protein YagU involved in acid resistance
MTYEPETFDVVLEKGTLDAVMVHERDPWNISTETENSIEKVLYQVIYFGFSAHPSGHMNSPLVFSGVHVAQSLVVCSVFFNIVVSVVLFLLAIVYSVLSSKASDIFQTFFCTKESTDMVMIPLQNAMVDHKYISNKLQAMWIMCIN